MTRVSGRIFGFEILQELEGDFGRTDGASGQPALPIAGSQQIECIGVLSSSQPASGASSGGTIENSLGQPVILNQPQDSIGNSPPQHGQTGIHVIAGINAFSNIVHECCEQQIFVPRAAFASQFKDLQAMVEHIALRVRFPILDNFFERQQEGQEVLPALICARRICSMQATVGRNLLIECHTNFQIGGQRFWWQIAASDCAGGGPASLSVVAALPAGHESGCGESNLFSQSFVFHISQLSAKDTLLRFCVTATAGTRFTALLEGLLIQ